MLLPREIKKIRYVLQYPDGKFMGVDNTSGNPFPVDTIFAAVLYKTDVEAEKYIEAVGKAMNLQNMEICRVLATFIVEKV